MAVSPIVGGQAIKGPTAKLMREFGLILENLDGFDDLSRKFVMRSVPHILALNTSLKPAANGADGTTTPRFVPPGSCSTTAKFHATTAGSVETGNKPFVCRSVTVAEVRPI